MSTVEAILQRWPLAAMCHRLNIDLPARGKFRSPFRPDNNPSCEVWKETIKDRSSGETFDSIRVYAEAKGISNSEAIRELAAEMPGSNHSGKVKVAGVAEDAPREPLAMPGTTATRRHCAELAELRKLPFEAVEAASLCLGTVRFSRVCGHRVWLITDGTHIAEARRMDGKLFEEYKSLGERKAHTLRGSVKSWPVGLQPKHYVPADAPVVLGEGGPDYLALCAVALETKPEFLPAVMLGSSASIHADALPLFAGRAVVIVAHPDDAGRDAAIRWRRQLKLVAASVRVMQLEGGDVNDIVSEIGAAAFAQEVLK